MLEGLCFRVAVGTLLCAAPVGCGAQTGIPHAASAAATRRAATVTP